MKTARPPPAGSSAQPEKSGQKVVNNLKKCNKKFMKYVESGSMRILSWLVVFARRMDISERISQSGAFWRRMERPPVLPLMTFRVHPLAPSCGWI
jgi:hypothetical protein